MIPDTTGVDLYPLVRTYAARYGVGERALVACLKAESGLNPTAARYGVWPDVSFGLGQQIVAYAPVGDGSRSEANIALVRDWLFERENAIKIAAAHLGGDRTVVASADTTGLPNDPDLLTLVVYNAGHLPPASDAYWTKYRGNVANYVVALQYADSVLKGGESP